MKKIKLKTACLSLTLAAALAVLPQPAYAKILSELPQEQTTTEQGEPAAPVGSTEVKAELVGEAAKISLDDAMTQALANSSDVLKAKNDLASAEVSYNQMKHMSKKAQDAAGLNISMVLVASGYHPGSDGYNAALAASGVNNLTGNMMVKDQTYYNAVVYGPEATKKAVELYTSALDAQEAACKLKVIQQYYTVLCDGQAEVAASYAHTKAENQLKIVQSRFDQGMATKLELLQAQTQLNAQKAALDAARANTVQAKRTMNVLLGREPNANWSPSTKLSYEPLLIADPEAKAQEMMQIAPMVNVARITFELAELNFDNTVYVTPVFTYAGQTAELTYETAKIDYETAQDNYYIGAKAMLEQLSLARSQYETYEQSQSLLEEVYRLSQLQYENGLNTQADVQSAAADIVANDASRLSALLQYNVLKTAIEQGLIQ